MDDPTPPPRPPGQGGSSSGAAAKANGVQQVVDPRTDAPLMALMLVMMLLGLTRWYMTPCVC